jgi:hypothetical protein
MYENKEWDQRNRPHNTLLFIGLHQQIYLLIAKI